MPPRSAHRHEHGPTRVALSTEQIADAGITLAEAKGGGGDAFLAPGSLIPDADHVARVSVRVLATVLNCARSSAIASRRARLSQPSRAGR